MRDKFTPSQVEILAAHLQHINLYATLDELKENYQKLVKTAHDRDELTEHYLRATWAVMEADNDWEVVRFTFARVSEYQDSEEYDGMSNDLYNLHTDGEKYVMFDGVHYFNPDQLSAEYNGQKLWQNPYNNMVCEKAKIALHLNAELG